MRTTRSSLRGALAAPAILAACLLAPAIAPPAASAAAEVPLIRSEGFSEITETGATLEGTVNPGERKTRYRFQYLTDAAYQANPPAERFAGATEAPSPEGIIPEGSEDAEVATALSGLAPGTAYHFRLLAWNSKSGQENPTTGPERLFATFSEGPLSGPCPNEAFRTGALAPPGRPSAALPDCRAYEQVSPADKDGNDAVGEFGFSKAAADGSAATFLSTSGIPGGSGAQQFPTYAGFRGEAGWQTHGLLPPPAAGPRAALLGWTPDFSQTLSRASRVEPGALPEPALFLRHDPAAAPVRITPYSSTVGSYAYAGSSADGSELVFEATGQLPPEEGAAPIAEARPGASNVYAYEEADATTHLASRLNTPEETEAALSKGAFAGPYAWALGNSGPEALGEGGAAVKSYTQDERAVSAGGSVFFTAAGTGQLYERLNPTEPQSALDGEGDCTEADKACTLHLSASERTPADPAGAQPAAFQAATADGTQAFFTSAEELTGDANTGPPVPPAQIGRAQLNGEGAASATEEGFLPAHAVGIAFDASGGHVYWADPLAGTIGRAALDGSGNLVPGSAEPAFIAPEATEFEVAPEVGPPFTITAPASPRYVALGPCAEGGECVYWTNTGAISPRNLGSPYFTPQGRPIDGSGSVGRARLDGSGSLVAGSADPEFISGASNPQGIAVDASSVYWANDGNQSLGRAQLDGGGVEQSFFHEQERFYGLAISPSYIYFAGNNTEVAERNGFVSRLPLGGGEDEFVTIGEESKLRGIAVDGSYVYWAAQGEGAIGRAKLTDFHEAFPHNCPELPGCEREFLEPAGGLNGLAVQSNHLYWSVNGETPPNPGSDLYRFSAAPDSEGHHLTDLTPDSADVNGAEVLGVLGASADGSYVYFAADGDLDGSGPGFAGDCHGQRLASMSGRCDLYLDHEGQISFIAPLLTHSGGGDGLDWLPATFNSVVAGSAERTSFTSPDGRTLAFLAGEPLAGAASGGEAQWYRYRAGQPGLQCLTCDPTGAGGTRPSLGELSLPGGERPDPTVAAVSSRNLSAGGGRFFFQTRAGLVGGDTDGQGGCPEEAFAGLLLPSCQDVYEWEAPGEGECVQGGPAYSPLNGGCLYLLSPGNDASPALFSDASASGEDVFILSRDQLVGQDTDSLLDLYDARAGGGLAAQNPQPGVPCEGEASCRPAASPPPPFTSPPQFSGPPNPAPKRCRKGRALRHGRCLRPRHRKKHRHRKHHNHRRR
jgi:hypothetical protein